jgi:phospholipase C
VDPKFTILDIGTGNDDHPPADIQEEDNPCSRHSKRSPTAELATTVFVVNFDEWGGSFEHVGPPRATAGKQVDSRHRRRLSLRRFPRDIQATRK